jgi:hypothetical protein
MISSSESNLEKSALGEVQGMQIHPDRKIVTTHPGMAEKLDLETGAQSLSLPPIDHGIQAWLFLAGSFTMEMLVFGTIPTCSLPSLAQGLIRMPTGFGFSFGVFQDYYTTHAPFAGSGGVAVIGTLTTVRQAVYMVVHD